MLAYTIATARETELNKPGRKDMDETPNAGEIIERPARENERQRIEIEQLKQRINELERRLTEKAD